MLLLLLLLLLHTDASVTISRILLVCEQERELERLLELARADRGHPVGHYRHECRQALGDEA